MDFTVLLILLVSFVATLVRSTFGFGESLVAVPLFLFFLPAAVAVPLAVMISILIAAIILVQDHAKIHFYSAKRLILYGALGIPIGLLILIRVDEFFIKLFLGILITIYAIYSLLGRFDFSLSEDNNKWLFGCGFISGVLGGAYGLSGPPLVIYGSLRKWTADYFRATMQAYFLPSSLFGLVGYYANNLVTGDVIRYFTFSLITVIPAIFIGRFLNLKMKNHTFLNYVYILLIVIGCLLIINSLA